MGESLSSCHLNNQRLINPLDAEVDESAHLIESTRVTPLYKISRFHVRRAKLGVASQGQSLTSEALARHRVPRVGPKPTLTLLANSLPRGDQRRKGRNIGFCGLGMSDPGHDAFQINADCNQNVLEMSFCQANVA